MMPLLTAIQRSAVTNNQLRSRGVSDVCVSDMVRMECLFYPHPVPFYAPLAQADAMQSRTHSIIATHHDRDEHATNPPNAAQHANRVRRNFAVRLAGDDHAQRDRS